MTNAMQIMFSKLPYGLFEFNQALSNKKRLAIVKLLFDNSGLHFSTIAKELDIPKNSLSQHLKILLHTGVVRRIKSKWNEKKRYFKSLYDLNLVYRKLLEINIDYLSNRQIFCSSNIETPELLEPLNKETSPSFSGKIFLTVPENNQGVYEQITIPIEEGISNLKDQDLRFNFKKSIGLICCYYNSSREYNSLIISGIGLLEKGSSKESKILEETPNSETGLLEQHICEEESENYTAFQ